MDQRAKVLIGTLLIVIAVMAVGLVAAAADGSGNSAMGGMRMNGADPYVGMMQAMGGMNSDAMLTHMRDVLGEDGYRRMQDHWRNHRASGPMTGNPATDEMMHQMMDSMMQRMPADRDRMLPLPAATPTPTPSR